MNYGGVPTKKSPYRIYVSQPTNPGKVQVFGPGVEKGIKSQKSTHFNIDARDAGAGDLAVAITDEKGQAIPYELSDNGDGTFSVDYSPPTPGNYKVSVKYAGQEVPQSPIRVAVQPHVDVSKVKVDGLEPSVFADSPTDFVVDSRAISKVTPGGKVSCTITNPSGARTDNYITPMADGTYRISYTPFEEGRHVIDILYDGVPIPGSPLQ